MWLPWGRTKSGRRKFLPENTSLFTSFKDVGNLCNADDEPTKKAQPSHIIRRTGSSPFRLPPIFLWQSLPSFAIAAPAAEPDNIENVPPEEPVGNCAALPPKGEKKIVLYYTSLRIVRKTFHDCGSVRQILKGFRVSIDERDLSMDAGFFRELEELLGGKRLSLPRVFIGGRYIGGADEIRQLHESGELKKFVEGLPPADLVCDCCGGHRFVLCYSCDGSHKCYSDKGGFRSCPNCNENGLIRCPSCS